MGAVATVVAKIVADASGLQAQLDGAAGQFIKFNAKVSDTKAVVNPFDDIKKRIDQVGKLAGMAAGGELAGVAGAVAGAFGPAGIAVAALIPAIKNVVGAAKEAGEEFNRWLDPAKFEQAARLTAALKNNLAESAKELDSIPPKKEPTDKEKKAANNIAIAELQRDNAALPFSSLAYARRIAGDAPQRRQSVGPGGVTYNESDESLKKRTDEYNARLRGIQNDFIAKQKAANDALIEQYKSNNRDMTNALSALVGPIRSVTSPLEIVFGKIALIAKGAAGQGPIGDFARQMGIGNQINAFANQKKEAVNDDFEKRRQAIEDQFAAKSNEHTNFQGDIGARFNALNVNKRDEQKEKLEAIRKLNQEQKDALKKIETNTAASLKVAGL